MSLLQVDTEEYTKVVYDVEGGHIVEDQCDVGSITWHSWTR